MLKKILSYFRRPVVIVQQMGTGISANINQPGNTDYGNGAKYPGGMSSARLVVQHDHLTLRQHARDAMYDSMEARSLVESIVDTVVETGLKLKPTPNAGILKITPEAAEEWSENIAESFHLWANAKRSHKARINNYYQNQRLYQLFQQRDNDIFVRLYYSRDKDLTNPLQIDFLDPNQIRGYATTSTYTQAPGDDGIIRDAGGREIAFKIWYYDGNGGYQETTIPAMGEKSGRIMMLHGFNPEYAGQGRGYPRLSHIIQEIHNLTGFKLSVIQKAINQSSFFGAVENDVQDASQPLAGRAVGAVREYASDESTEATTVADTEPIMNFSAMPEASITQPGSVMIGNLRRGDKLKYLQDTSPGPQYDTFEKNFFSSIAASVGWSEEVVRKKFSNNYSASRATLILIYRVAQIWQNEMASDFNDPIYEMWLSEEIAAGRVTCPGWNDPRLRAAWLSCEWAGAPMPNIDPQKSAEADRAYVELGAQTLDDVARNYNGSSGKANRTKNARQFEELPEPPWNETPSAPASVEPVNPEEDTDNA
jgi:lambda family phage portal protein